MKCASYDVSVDTNIRHHGEPGHPGGQGLSGLSEGHEKPQREAKPSFLKRPMARWLGALAGALALVIGIFAGVAIEETSHSREAAELRAQTDRMAAQLADAEEVASSAEAAATEASDQVDGLQEQITDLTEELSSETSKTEEAVQAAADARTEVEEAVATVGERDARIQELEAQVSSMTPAAPQAPVAPAAPSSSYANCSEVRAAGAAPIYAGEPGYGRHLDRDGDGVGCE